MFKPLMATPALAQGQRVIIAARWIFVAGGLMMSLLMPSTLGRLRLIIFIAVALAITNFYLLAQTLRRQPTLQAVIYGTSLIDLIVITFLVIGQGGFYSNLYVFY